MKRYLYIFIALFIFSCGGSSLEVGVDSDLLSYPSGDEIDSVDVIPPDTIYQVELDQDSLFLITDSFEKRYDIKFFVVHCTATPPNTTPESIQRYWRVNLGWKNPGYHFLILRDGSIYMLKRVVFNPYLTSDLFVNGVKGMNKYSIHVSYIGGMHGDDRTKEQKETLDMLVGIARNAIPGIEVVGHRDIQIHTNKSCPNFDVREEYGSKYMTSEAYDYNNKILERVIKLNQ